METTRLVARVTVVIVAVGALLGAGTLAQANEQPAVNGSKARAIEGVWLPLVTIRDCQTQAEIITFPSMDIYVRGGGFIGLVR